MFWKVLSRILIVMGIVIGIGVLFSGKPPWQWSEEGIGACGLIVMLIALLVLVTADED